MSSAASSQAAASPAATRTLRLLSWNVAGLGSILELVKQTSYGTLEAWMQSMQLDLLLVQESKLQLDTVRADSPKAGCIGRCGGASYESFWSCSSAPGKLGMAGVTTFASSAFSPVAADSAPLGDAELDAEGRVLVTDHAHFYVVNVYVIWGGERGKDGLYLDAARGATKLRFLGLLGALVRRLRASKPVILAGDLNIGMDAQDVHPERRATKGYGYSEEEQQWLAELLGRGGAEGGEGEGEGQAPLHFVDLWRSAHPRAEVYSCFENKTMARQANKGSRIDYILASRGAFFDACMAQARDCCASPSASTSSGSSGGSGGGGAAEAAHSSADASLSLSSSSSSSSSSQAASAPAGSWAASVSMEEVPSLTRPGIAIVRTPGHWSDHLALLLVCHNVPVAPEHKPCQLSSRVLFRPKGGDIKAMFAAGTAAAAATAAAGGGGGSAGGGGKRGSQELGSGAGGAGEGGRAAKVAASEESKAKGGPGGAAGGGGPSKKGPLDSFFKKS